MCFDLASVPFVTHFGNLCVFCDGLANSDARLQTLDNKTPKPSPSYSELNPATLQNLGKEAPNLDAQIQNIEA